MKNRLIKFNILLFTLAIFACIFFIHTSVSYGAINKEINYQGKLTNSSNVTVADGTYAMEFKLYTQVSGGAAIWTETWSGANEVQVTSGLFSVMLGSTTAFTGVDFNQTLYLGVNIEGDGEMTPRKRFGAVPAAFVSDTLDNLSSEQFLRSDATNSTSTASTFLTFIQNGAGKVAEFFGPGSSSVLSILSSGNVGIGTTTPYAKLSVVGQTVAEYFTSTSTTAINTFPLLTATTATTTGTAYFGSNVGLGTSTPGTLLSLGNTGANTINISATATSTFGSGINLRTGCFAINGTCVGTGSSNGVSFDYLFPSNATSTLLSFNGGLTSYASTTIGGGTQTSGLTINGGATTTGNAYFGGNVGIGTTTPFATFAINPIAGQASNQFVVGSSTATNFTISNAGNVGIKGTPTSEALYVNGNIAIAAGLASGFIGQSVNNGYNPINNSGTAFINASGNFYVSVDSNNDQTDRAFIIAKDGSTTNGTELLRVQENGNVGIGTTSPYAKLSVDGRGVFNQDVRADYFTATSTTVASTFTYASTTVVSSAGSAYFATSAGNVGIGTTTPVYKLDVYGTDSIFRAGNASAYIDFNNGDSFSQLIGVSTGGVSSWSIGTSDIFGDTAALNLNTRTADSPIIFGVDDVQKMILDDTGNLGIGTSTPGTLLSLGNTGANTINLSPTATSTFGSGINLRTGCFAINGTCISGGGGSGVSTFLALTDTDQSAFTANRIIHTNTGGTGLTDTDGFVFNGTNLGIGTTSPYAKLSVVGQTVAEYFTSTSTTAINTFPLLSATTATTTNLSITGLTSTFLKTNSLGQVIAAVAGTDYANFGYLFPSNATSTLLSFNGGLTSYASTTIGGGTQTSGLTINGGATTTGNAYFGGNVGMGTTSPGTLLSLGNTGDNTINISTTATSTFGSGINLRTGCFAINGTCVGAGGSGSGTVNSGTTGQLAYYNGNGTAVIGTSSISIATNQNVSISNQLTVGTGLTVTAGNVSLAASAKIFAGGGSDTLYINSAVDNGGSFLGAVHIGDAGGVGGTDAGGSDVYIAGGGLTAGGGTIHLSRPGSTGVAGNTLVYGNLGVGTTSPYAKLSVAGQTVSAYFTATTSQASTFPYASTTVFSSSGTTYLGTGTGNVGIGTTTLGYKLTVHGDSFFTSDINLQNTATVQLRSYDNISTTGILGGSVDVQGAMGLWAQDGGGDTPIATFNQNDNAFSYSDNQYVYDQDSWNHTFTGNVLASLELGIGTTSPGTILSIGDTGANAINISATATSTFGSGINLRSGCFAVNGTCVGAGGAGASTFIALTDTDQSSFTANRIIHTNTGGTGLTDTAGFVFTGTNLGIGTTSPYARLSVAGAIVGEYFHATSTTATSTFAGGLYVNNGGLAHDFYTGITSISSLETGNMSFEDDAGLVSWTDLTVTSAAAADTPQGYTAFLDGNPLLSLFGLADGFGGLSRYGVGIGSSTPWGKLSVESNGDSPALVVSDSTLTTNYPLLFVTSTTTGSLDYARVAVGTSTSWGTGGLRDQFTVAGRINSTWHYISCEFPSVGRFGTGAALASDQAAGDLGMCGPGWFLDIDTDGGVAAQVPVYPPSIRLQASPASVAAGDGAHLIMNRGVASATTSPVIEFLTRIPIAHGSNNTNLILGFHNYTTGADTAVLPTDGMYFSATSSATWKAVSRKASSETIVDTGIATTTSFQRLRIEAEADQITYLINGNVVAVITNNIPILTLNTGATIAVTTGAGGVTRNVDISYIKLWVDDPPGGFGEEINNITSNEKTPYDAVYGADVALSYLTGTSSESFKEGMIVSGSETIDNGVRLSQGKYDKEIMGVISTSPYNLLGNGGEGTVKMSLVGRVPVSVSLENGPIKKGDRITSSSVSGFGMKASRAGYIIGRALSDFDPENGKSACLEGDGDIDYSFVQEIPKKSFAECRGTVMVHLDPGFDMGMGDMIQDIGETVLAIPEAVTDLANSAFKKGAELTKFVIGKLIASIAVIGDLFTKNVTVLPDGEITLPSGENQISGEAVIPAGAQSILVLNNRVASTSKIYLTPRAALGQSLSVTENREKNGFVVSLKKAEDFDIPFDWMIINSYGTGAKSEIQVLQTGIIEKIIPPTQASTTPPQASSTPPEIIVPIPTPTPPAVEPVEEHIDNNTGVSSSTPEITSEPAPAPELESESEPSFETPVETPAETTDEPTVESSSNEPTPVEAPVATPEPSPAPEPAPTPEPEPAPAPAPSPESSE